MTATLTGIDKNTIELATDAAEVGRWAKAPFVPDRCYFCNNPATGRPAAVDYVEYAGWRYGRCQTCKDQRKNL